MILKGKFEKGKDIFSYLDNKQKKNIICAKIDGIVYPLSYIFADDYLGEIELLDLTSCEATRIYCSSIRFILAMAMKEISPSLNIKYSYDISRSILVSFESLKEKTIDLDFVNKIKEKMNEIIKKDLKFIRRDLSYVELLEIYKKQNEKDKALNLSKVKDRNLVYCLNDDGFSYYDDYSTFMVYSTSVLNKYDLQLSSSGLSLLTPRSELKGELPEFKDEKKFSITLQDTYRWSLKNQFDTVAGINEFIDIFGAMGFVNVCEARINDLLSILGKQIEYNKELKIICIAGPSSSGKTSFANRLMYELMARGIKSLRITLDNYFIPKRLRWPSLDVESVEALDTSIFLDNYHDLILGKEVSLPSYNFKDGLRTFSKPVVLEKDEVIIIEGIHALNNKLTAGIPENEKFKIYIAPQPRVNIDNHNPVSMTDLRLIRRIARDERSRGTKASVTIDKWSSVRLGEFKYVYPTQENSDFVFDSYLPYEPCVLKRQVINSLKQIQKDDKAYLTALRIIDELKYFKDIDCDDIPCNSIIKEFVGGSSFKDAQ